MNIYCSQLWISDLDEVLSGFNDTDRLAGKRVMITGCTGLICSAVMDVLIRWNETHDKKIFLVAAGRNAERIRDRFGSNCEEDWFEIVSFDAVDPGSLEGLPEFRFDYIIHGASNASPGSIIKEPVETMMANIMGTKQLLEVLRLQAGGRLLYISSSEVYGDIDILNPRSSYSVGKSAAETLCVSYLDEYGVDSVIVRPGHIYGPTATTGDNRVASAWTGQVASGDDIVMKSDGSQIRSYVYAADCAAAILKVLLCGGSGKAYNISNPDSVISIKQLAEYITDASGVRLILDKPTDDEKKGFNPMQDSSLDATELMELGWRGKFDAKQGIKQTIAILKQFSDESKR